MGKILLRRSYGGEVTQKTSDKGKHHKRVGWGDIMEEAAWKGAEGRETMRKKPERTNCGAGILEDRSWRIKSEIFWICIM